jgi:TetR/AcrR family transcriptional regulator, mexCD-oprJ operon repressor
MSSQADSPNRSRHDRAALAILDASAQVLAALGPQASMAEVASGAGISRATLYRYYRSREDLLQALADRAVEEAGRRIADAGLEHCAVPEAIERIVRALLTVGERYTVLTQDQAGTYGDGQDTSAIGDPIRQVISRGVSEGSLRDDVPVQALDKLFGGLIIAAVNMLGEGTLGLEDTTAATARLFLGGAQANPRDHHSAPVID